jgi:hypothetical protein
MHDLSMENVRKIMEIIDDDEMFPTRNEWAYIQISNELKQLHLKLKELSHPQATIYRSIYKMKLFIYECPFCTT